MLLPMNVKHEQTRRFWRCLRLMFFIFICGAGAQEFYVSPTGNDSGLGTQVSPFATLERARTAVRAAVRNVSPAVIWLGGGDYLRTNEFLLSSSDTNCLYRAVPGETPRLVGGPRLDPAWFTLVTSNSPVWSRLATAAKSNLWQVDLGAHGITNFGTLARRGFGSSPNGAMELYINGRPQQLARWPNAGSWTTIATVVDTNNFTYSGTQPVRWSLAEEPWFHGFFGNYWADFAVKSAGINTNTKTITLTLPVVSYGLVVGQPYFAFNLLEEIDAVGEYYIQRNTGMLYVWPPSGFTNAEVFVSVLESPMVHVTGARDITLDGLALIAARDNLIQVDSGTRVKFNNCRLLGTGTDAASISGTSNGLNHCEIAYAGGKGVVLSGGNRSTLAQGGNYARQSLIHDFSRLTLTYTPGVSVNGVGQIAEHNEIYGASHSAIIFSGNEHHMEYNHIHDVCQWSSDAGAIYCGRDWGLRGNLLRYNFIHDINTGFGGLGVHAIYLDDCSSGLAVFGNVIYRVETQALKNGGGRDNAWENNVVAQCGIFHAGDARGLTRITTNGDSWDLLAKIRANNYQQPPWSNAYPALAVIPNDYTLIGPYKPPGGTVFSRNVSWQNTTDYSQSDSSFGYYAQMTTNLTGQNPLFVNEASLDLTLQANSPAFGLAGFQPIPFRDIGISPLTWDALPATPGAQNGNGIWIDGGSNWWDGASATWNNNLPADVIIGVTNGASGYTVTLGSDIIARRLTVGQTGSTNVGTLDLSAASATVSALTVQTDTSNANTLLIGTGQTFTVLGNCTIGPNISTNAVTKLTALGAGTLIVSNLGGSLQIGGATGSANANAAMLDLGGLTNFTVNLGSTGTVRVGDMATTSSGSRGTSSAILAANSTITTGTLGVGDTTGGGTVETLKLGDGTTIINANTINIGLATSTGRSSGQVLFNNASGSLIVRGAAGGASRATLNLGNHASGTGATITGLLGLAGHSADLMLSSVTIASRRTNSAANDIGTLTFDAGMLNVSTLLLGQRQMATNGTSAGTLVIGGGTATLGSITLADSLTTNGTANGTLTLTGGTVTVTGNISKGSSLGLGAAIVTFDGATLDMTGFAIGGTTPVTFNALSGTLKNVAQINNGAALVKNSTGTLTLAGTNRYTGTTTVNTGTLILAGSLNCPVTVTGGVFCGSGTISNSVTISGGTNTPGNPLGIMSLTGSYLLNTGGTFHVTIHGLLPGTQYGQLKLAGATGTVTLAGALQIAATNGLPTNASFVIITNAGSAAVNGMFAGKPEGYNFPASGYWWRVSYAGGTGNDVALTLVPPPTIALSNSFSLTNPAIQLTLTCDSNHTCQIQASTNLANWTTLFTTNSPALPFKWADSNASRIPSRYYRFLLGP
jgi:hypothetical protein